MTTDLTSSQKHILAHFRGGVFSAEKSIDDQLSAFNEMCLVGMIETREITFIDLQEVGGVPLVARIAKKVTPSEIR